jgi:hypothetical protein
MSHPVPLPRDMPTRLSSYSLSAPWGGESRGEVGGGRTHLTLPIAGAMGPLPLPPQAGGEGEAAWRQDLERSTAGGRFEQ